MSTRVDALERFDLGGPAQWALVRGRADRPVLLLVQAGPGLPMIHEARATERRLHLEEHFRVVYWDQRGTGKSFDPRDRETWTLDTLVGDVRAMVRALCDRLGVAELDLVGFSFGASLALLACAEDAPPVRSLVCVGPDVDLLAAEQSALAFALAEAERRGQARALRSLRAIGAPPHADPDRFMTRAKWVANFGGVHRRMGFGAMLRTTLARLWTSPHYTLRERIGALRGIGATLARTLPVLQGFDLLARPLRLGMPVTIFQGRHDVAAPPSLAEALAGRLGADLVWFEDSAHLPHEEEPERFRAELLMALNDRASAPIVLDSSRCLC
jgi:pimeloyl-ACP methyl ester carboxylesterase